MSVRTLLCWALLLLVVIAAFCFRNALVPPTVQPRANSKYLVQADHFPFKFSVPQDDDEISFRLDWPPSIRPGLERSGSPLLNGVLVVGAGEHAGQTQLATRIELRRGQTESDRTSWNRRLRFPDLDWMSAVEVWDTDHKWRWPNLPFPLRANGVERQQRYGGVDPKKGVDNDFAAIVVRPLSVDNATHPFPLITAEWHPPAGDAVDKRTIVHDAISDDLRWDIPASEALDRSEGVFGVWLIYADFLGYDPPRSWPNEPEYDGGILAYFEVRWRLNRNDRIEILSAQQEVPKQPTGVNWVKWQEMMKTGLDPTTTFRESK